MSASRRTAVAVYTWGPWEEGYYKCIESLTAAGADVNVPDEFGWNSGYVALLEAGYNGDARKIRLYLKAGVYINDTEIYGNSALEQLINNWPKTPEEEDAFKEAALLLLAAGERMTNVTGNIPEYLQPTLTLKDMCRRAIGNRLIELDPKHNLFKRIPLLKLPNILRRYLLYNMSLETSKKNVNADDGGSAQPVLDDQNGKGKEEKENGSV